MTQRAPRLDNASLLPRAVLVAIALFAVVVLPAEGASAQVVLGVRINEFSAANAQGIVDNTGEPEDWIELHNTTGATIDLTGWSLDAGGDIAALDGLAIDAGDHIVVFASGEPERTVAGEMHLPFRLSAEGESLQLRDPAGTIADPAWPAPGYPSQRSDESFGVASDGQLRLFDVPTPGQANNAGVEGRVEPVTFSVPHGHYTAAQTVVLDSATPGSTIRYTLDGSTPTAANGTALAPGQALTVSSTSTLRAIASRPGWATSPSTTSTYLFTADIIVQPETTPPGWPTDPAPPSNQRMIYGMDPTIVSGNEAALEASLRSFPSLSIVTDLPNLFDPAEGIYVNAYSRGREWEVPISLELIDPAGQEAGFTTSAGLRIRGASTRSPVYAKHNLGFFFRDEYGGELEYPLFGDDGASRFEKVDLRSAQGIDWARFADPESTIMREMWLRDSQAAMGQPHTRSRPYHLYINGQYWGVFLTQERLSGEYGEQYFGGDESDYDVMKHNYTEPFFKGYRLSEGDDAAWRSLHALVVDEVVDDADFAVIESQVDLANLADYYLLHIWAGSFDGAPDPGTGGRSNNWFAVRNRTGAGEAGQWQFFHHDAEASLCVRNTTNMDQSTPWDLTSGGFLSPEYMTPPWLHQPLLTHPAYRQIFIDRVALHMAPGGALDPAVAVARWNDRAAQFGGGIDAHAARWGDAYGNVAPRTKADWLAEVQNVRDCIAARPAIVQSQLQADGLWPTVDAPALTPAAGSHPFDTPISVAAAGPGVVYVTTDGSDPRALDGSVAAGAFAYAGPLLLDGDLTVRARVLDGGSWSPLAEAAYTLSTPDGPPRLVLNEYNAVSGTKYLGDGAAGEIARGVDANLGRVAGNGGDWIEFVVVEDHLDVRGWTVEVWGDDGAGFVRDAEIVLGNSVVLSDLRAGTMLTISEDQPDDLSYNPPAGDWHINLQANAAGDGAHVVVQSAFAVNNNGTQIAVFDELGHPEMLRTGEGTAPNASVSSTEVFKLEGAPGAAVGPDDPNYNDGTSSTWGLPNVYDAGAAAQDLSGLRLDFGNPNCDASVTIVDALFIAQYVVGNRSDAQCPLPDATRNIHVAAGDVNNNGVTDIIDALLISQCEVGIPNVYCP